MTKYLLGALGAAIALWVGLNLPDHYRKQGRESERAAIAFEVKAAKTKSDLELTRIKNMVKEERYKMQKSVKSVTNSLRLMLLMCVLVASQGCTSTKVVYVPVEREKLPEPEEMKKTRKLDSIETLRKIFSDSLTAETR